MKYSEYLENSIHGTKEFPYAYYFVNNISPKYNMVYHWHNEYELIFVVKGSLDLFVDGETATVEEGGCALISGGSLHAGTPHDCIYECVVFDVNPLLKVNPLCLRDMQPIINQTLKISPFFLNVPPIKNAAENIFASLRNQEKGYQFVIPGELLKIFGYVFSSVSIKRVDEKSIVDMRKIRRFKNVISYIEEHYSEVVTLNDLAAVANMNSNYFCRAFYQFAKKTPVEYLNYYRIEAVCEMILTTSNSLLDISFSCGFNDYSYFNKVFKKYKNMTPKQYEQEQYSLSIHEN